MSRDRDQILEEALKHELRATASPLTDACLDAEILAAWQDDALDAGAEQAIEAHLSTCSRCQAMVAVFTRGLAGQQASELAEASAPSSFAFWKWLAPLAAGAAAVTLWMVVPEQRQIAEAPPQPAAPAAMSETVEPQAPPAETPSLADATAPAQPARDNRSLDAPRDTVAAGRERAQRRDAEAPQALEARKEAPAPLAKAVIGGAAATPPPAVAPPPSPAPSAPAPAAAAAPAPAPPRLAGRAASESAVADLQRNAQFAVAPVEIISPAPSQRWRVNAIGVERSVDGGGSWSLVRPTAGEVLTSGTSPSPNVCWLIGVSGIVMVTADGTTFTRNDIPNAGDLKSIAATNSRSATVVSTAGRTFRTDDGGRTWR